MKICHEPELRTTKTHAKFAQAILILDVIAKHIMIIQSDTSSVKDVIQAFLEIRGNWSTLLSEKHSELEKIFIKGWKIVSEGLMGMLAHNFQDFPGLTPEAEV